MATASAAMPGPHLCSALMGEFLGTALLILLGDGVVAGAVLLGDSPDQMRITTGWGLAVALAVYLSGRLSGGHVNPAVTLALAARGVFPWSRVLPYWGAQLAGAILGASLVYVDYADAFWSFERDHQLIRGAMAGGKLVGPAAGGAGVFATYPAFDTLWRNFLSEFMATAVLLLGVRALTDRRNAAPGGYVEPLALGALVWAIGVSLGGLTGYAINPARSGPAHRLGRSWLGDGRVSVAQQLFLDPHFRPARGRTRGRFPLRFRHPPPPTARNLG